MVPYLIAMTTTGDIVSHAHTFCRVSRVSVGIKVSVITGVCVTYYYRHHVTVIGYSETHKVRFSGPTRT